MPITQGAAGFIPQWTEYIYASLLAAGVQFIPPGQTIVYLAQLYEGAQDLDILYGTEIVKSGTDLGVTEQGYNGGCYFDGTFFKYENTDVAAHLLHLNGVSMA